MDKMSETLTVFFEEPFWVGVCERVSDGKLSVCKITFGAEPREYDVLDYILRNYYELKFSPAVDVEVRRIADNPKRRQRNARKMVKNCGIGTKSQQALQKQREEMKTGYKQISKARREEESRRQFELKQQKRKEKHRGH